MSYDAGYKNTVLRSSGYADDTPEFIDEITNNDGFWQRLKIVAKDVDQGGNKFERYNPEGGTLISKLGVDLDSAGPLINGISVRLEYTLSDPQFFLFGKAKVKGKKKQKTEDSSTSESTGTGTGTGTGTDASATATPSTTEAAKKTAVSWLSTTEKYTFTIHKFILHVLVHELQPNLYETLEANLKTTPAIMSFKRYSCIPYTIPRGLTEWLSDSLLPS